jgi:iron complex transport system substrate-binding protein
MEQVIAWAPDTIVTWDANFFASYGTNPLWATVPAVAAKRVYLAPRLPFGWIDAPPSINRYIGLRWIARLLYPDRFRDDIRTTARDFFKLLSCGQMSLNLRLVESIGTIVHPPPPLQGNPRHPIDPMP